MSEELRRKPELRRKLETLSTQALRKRRTLEYLLSVEYRTRVLLEHASTRTGSR